MLLCGLLFVFLILVPAQMFLLQNSFPRSFHPGFWSGWRGIKANKTKSMTNIGSPIDLDQ